MQCKLTFKRRRWRLSCSESVNFRKPSLSSIIVCLDFKIVRSGFTESLYLVCMTRAIINSDKPGRKTQERNQHYSVITDLWQHILGALAFYTCSRWTSGTDLCRCHQQLTLCITSALLTICTGGSLNFQSRSSHSLSRHWATQATTGATWPNCAFESRE